jgi:hypothetical protein
MNLADTEQKSTYGAVVFNTANTRLTGSRLTFARVLWLLLVIPSLGLCIASLIVSYQQMQTVCLDSVTCNHLPEALPVHLLHALLTLGISASGYAALLTILNVITAAIWYEIGFFIFWRRSDDWLALLAAFVLVMFNVTSLSNNNVPSALALASPILAFPLSVMNFLGLVSLYMFFLLFPSGRLVPRWMVLILLLVIIQAFFDNFPSPTSTFDAHWPGRLKLLFTLVIYGSIIYSQIYRYRHVSTPVQRQQTKWIILGVATAIVVAIGIIAIFHFIPTTVTFNLSGLIVTNIIWPAAFLLIPLSIGFSILRYRLYDIDLLINRTLVYGSLTTLLALLYFGLIFALQSLFQGLFHQNNAIAIVISTLIIAALFQPLRHRIQRFIDRRFYRSKYDAAKTLVAFSATLRSEVDLNQLREHLLTVVQETMQPAHVSLWLRSPQRHTEEPLRRVEKPTMVEKGF